jgi:hypothetical protein
MHSSFRILLKGLVLGLLLGLLLPLAPEFGTWSAYNHLFPGRVRLPFGENPAQAYNLSLYNIPAMFASHEIGRPKADDEYRILLIGDSSVWGTLLEPQDTLTGQLNQRGLTYCGKDAVFYNLGYPTISLTKDLLLLDYAARYRPDAVIWLTTLEAFPLDKQLASPLVANNAAAIESLIARYNLPLDPDDPALHRPTYLDTTLYGQRRPLADLIRLQLYGVMWAATGIDQVYHTNYAPPKTDFEPDDDAFYDLEPPLDENQLAYEILAIGMQRAPAPVLLVNEPMLVSQGENNHIRYNFFYPRWAYDTYREQLAEKAAENDWNYLDVWDILDADEFTNSAIHLTPKGTSLLASRILEAFQESCGP